MNDQNIITVWKKPHGDNFPSQYGIIDYAEWCACEQERMASRGRKTEIIPDDKGRIALADVK